MAIDIARTMVLTKVSYNKSREREWVKCRGGEGGREGGWEREGEAGEGRWRGRGGEGMERVGIGVR